ncbi:S1C family serine protease [Ligilactobacillus sp. LYQ60]|uniref:S1C family serine protease n=1 Tax=unclassified Ligilactobacillus TaxID=2767920 RepID=UPI003852006B
MTSKHDEPVKLTVRQIFVTGLVGGLLGSGLVVGGVAAYQHFSNSAVTPDNAVGTTRTARMKVNISTQTTRAFNKVKGAVVSVTAYSSGNSDTLQALLGGAQETTESEGSGVIYKKANGTAFIVTNNHVIHGAKQVNVILSNGKKLPAKVVGADGVTDLAVLKINGRDVHQVATFADSNAIKVGQPALAIGSPLGSKYATSLTEGIISAKKRTMTVKNEDNGQPAQATVIQTDAAINPGNSGGPLINVAGQVVGINSMKLASTGNGSATPVEGMGFAIPSNEVVTIINQLTTHGKVIRPALGIEAANLSSVPINQQQATLKLPDDVTKGVVVMKIMDNSPLKGVGIKSGDVITKIGNAKTSDIATLQEVLDQHKLGTRVPVTYYHHGQRETVTVKLTLESDNHN